MAVTKRLPSNFIQKSFWYTAILYQKVLKTRYIITDAHKLSTNILIFAVLYNMYVCNRTLSLLYYKKLTEKGYEQKGGAAMAWFFTDEVFEDTVEITGEDARHIIKSLRMEAGEQITLCSPDGIQHTCAIETIAHDCVVAKVLESRPCQNEPSVQVTLYQALPKGDKMDLIVQKAVELGVYKIVPVLTQRCVSRPDEKALFKKCMRWQKIARNAAQQARRGMIPKIEPTRTFTQAVQCSGAYDQTILFYECGGKRVGDILQPADRSIAIFIGSEGGFTPEEAALIQANRGEAATLGKRILRAETAPLAALSVIMYTTGNFA